MNTTLLRRCVGWGSVLVMGLWCVAGTASGQRMAMQAKTATLPAAAVDLGAVPSAANMKFTLYLQPSADRVTALRQYLVALQSPNDPAYRTWLTPTQFGQMFGAASEQTARVKAWAQANALAVAGTSPSGLSISLSGTAAQVEAALTPAIHSVQLAGKTYTANTAVPAIDASIAGDVAAIDGLNTVPETRPMTVASAQGTVTAQDSLAAIGGIVDANTSRIVTINSTDCVEDIDTGSQAAMHLLLQQASVQGITVIAGSGCGARGSAAFPAVFSEVTAVVPAQGITPPANPVLTAARPPWQNAPGLPNDLFRHEPDLATGDLTAFTATISSILASFPPANDGSPARLGNINATLYQLAPMKGLYTQADGSPAGTWEAATGLGVVDLEKLAQFFPRGSLSTYVSIDIPPYSATHGSKFTFTAAVKDISGQGNGAVPSGTITFTVGKNLTLASIPLVNGTAQTTYNQLPGGTYPVMASYSGDANYSPNASTAESITVTAETAALSGGGVADAPLGGTITLSITAMGTSGVGTPANNLSVHPVTADINNTYTAKLSGSGGTATGTVTMPAVQAGKDTFVVGCDTSDPSFTCTQQSMTANVTPATPVVTFTYTPNPAVQGQTIQFRATIQGAGKNTPAPSGNVNFSNNGVNVAPATVQSDGTATSNPTVNFNYSSSGNNFVATYGGDNNYTSASSANTSPSGLVATTAVASASPTGIAVGGSATLIATITPAQTSTATMGGTVTFTSGATKLCTANVSASVASCSAGFTTRGANAVVAAYSGDANFGASNSTNSLQVTVAKGDTAVAVTATPSTPVLNRPTTFTAAVTVSNGSSASVPLTGTVVFYVNGTAQTPSTLSNGQATLSTTLAAGANSVYAVYAGDSNWNGNQSSTLNYTVGANTSNPGNTNSVLTLTSNTNSAIAGTSILLTATLIQPSGSTATAAFGGSVTFYDLYNGQSTALGTSSVNSSGPASGVAQFSIAVLKQGTHALTAIYSGDSNYGTETSAPYTITLSDYTLTFAPASLTLASGSSASATATITPLTNFSGTVALTCLAPANTAITCSFSPTSVTGSGTSTLTVTTTALLRGNNEKMPRALGAITLAALTLGFLVPGVRRRKSLLFVVLFGSFLLTTAGCTNLNNAGGSIPSGGTPASTYNLTISSAGSDQTGAAVTHSAQFQLVVQ